MRLILASASPIRRTLLERAGVPHEVFAARIDEDALRAALAAEAVAPRDMADALAAAKARKVSEKHPEAMVIGADQVLEFEGTALAKAASVDEAKAQLSRMRGKPHRLYSAVVVAEAGKPVWRHIGAAELTMRNFSESYLDGYTTRNADALTTCVGGYKLEEEGARLFSLVEGDYFTVLGLPLIELIAYLALRGVIEK